MVQIKSETAYRAAIKRPTLIDVIKLRLYKMGITQTKLAEMLGLSNARVSEIMNGKKHGDRFLFHK